MIMKKKTIIILFAVVLFITGSIFTARAIFDRYAYPILDTNAEALQDEEIIVGPLCAVCQDRACSSLGEVYEEHIKI